MSTAVRSAATAAAVAVTVMVAVDADRDADPEASITARWADSSASTMRALPRYVSWIGPSFTFTEPV